MSDAIYAVLSSRATDSIDQQARCSHPDHPPIDPPEFSNADTSDLAIHLGGALAAAPRGQINPQIGEVGPNAVGASCTRQVAGSKPAGHAAVLAARSHKRVSVASGPARRRPTHPNALRSIQSGCTPELQAASVLYIELLPFRASWRVRSFGLRVAGKGQASAAGLGFGHKGLGPNSPRCGQSRRRDAGLPASQTLLVVCPPRCELPV